MISLATLVLPGAYAQETIVADCVNYLDTLAQDQALIQNLIVTKPRDATKIRGDLQKRHDHVLALLAKAATEKDPKRAQNVIYNASVEVYYL
jgi:hypothetical protein